MSNFKKIIAAVLALILFFSFAQADPGGTGGGGTAPCSTSC
jgi:hypothetical protein